MRRPNICNSAVGAADDSYKPQNLPPPKDEGRLSLVRRVLGGSRKKDGHSSSQRNRQFGVAISDLPLTNNSVPKVLHRLCVYLELNGIKIDGLFKLSAANSATVETLKNQFNTSGDAELELANDVNSVALLLIVWLKELPEPLLTEETVVELISLMHKYDGDSWWGPVCYESILTSGQISSNVIGSVLRLLHCYSVKYPSSMAYLPSVFCPLLTCEEFQGISSVDAIELTAKLIRDYSLIFKKRNLEVDCLNNTNSNAASVVPDRVSSLKQRKRKEKIDSVLKNERKFVRSNSEERPALNGTCGSRAMRRVSSHEDFSKSGHNVVPKCEIQLKKITLPLHERNACSPQRSRRLLSAGVDTDTQPEPSPTAAAGYAGGLYDENEHERRRNNERFAPQPQNGRRNVARRRRTKHRFSYSQAKENENNLNLSPPLLDLKAESGISNNSGNEIEVDVASLPVQLNFDRERSVKEETSDANAKGISVAGDDGEEATEEQDDRSSSPVSGVESPILDLNTFQGEIKDDPVPSLPWTSVHSRDERLVSPHNSMLVSHRAFTPVHRPFEDEPSLLDLGTQINNLKRKLKKYDEGFEREFGYRPSRADKLANPDTKKMSSMLSKLKKQLKTTKEECMKLAKCEKKELCEEIVIEVEKRLAEKRAHSARPESLEDMTHEQLVDEKTAIQKVLLQIEASFGRPTSNSDKLLVRGLYERYRTVKRMVLRNAPPKFKESVTELGTILEHEAMDFTASPPSSPQRPCSSESSFLDSCDSVSTKTTATTSQSSSSSSSSPCQFKVSDIPLDNLHSLPRNELIILQKSTRDEKRRLRRILKEREMDFQLKTGRRLQKEDRPSSFDSIYLDYKHAKAKLKFIDALMFKKK